jgi:hypothetical protein
VFDEGNKQVAVVGCLRQLLCELLNGSLSVLKIDLRDYATLNHFVTFLCKLTRLLFADVCHYADLFVSRKDCLRSNSPALVQITVDVLLSL